MKATLSRASRRVWHDGSVSPATIIRVAFVVASFVGGSGLFAYAIAWVAMPSEGDPRERGEWTSWVPYALFAAAALSLGDAGTYSRAAEGIGYGLSGVLLVGTSLFLAGLGVALVIGRRRGRLS
jgi:drug/metabolite transporter (DMT)-like permease